MSDEMNFYEEIAEKVAAESQTYIDRFLSDNNIQSLILKYVKEDKTVDEIVKILNKMLKTDEIRKQFNIPEKRKVVVYRKHINKILAKKQKEASQ